jgi:hypothetical protein
MTTEDQFPQQRATPAQLVLGPTLHHSRAMFSAGFTHVVLVAGTRWREQWAGYARSSPLSLQSTVQLDGLLKRSTT